MFTASDVGNAPQGPGGAGSLGVAHQRCAAVPGIVPRAVLEGKARGGGGGATPRSWTPTTPPPYLTAGRMPPGWGGGGGREGSGRDHRGGGVGRVGWGGGVQVGRFGVGGGGAGSPYLHLPSL